MIRVMKLHRARRNVEEEADLFGAATLCDEAQYVELTSGHLLGRRLRPVFLNLRRNIGATGQNGSYRQHLIACRAVRCGSPGCKFQ